MISNDNFTGLDSEENVLQEIEHLKNWKENYGSRLPYYIDYINNLLADHSDRSHKELCSLFDDENFIQQYLNIPEIAYMIVIITIYKSETSDTSISRTILDNGLRMEELIFHFRKIKFLLWNIEFDIDIENALDLLIEDILSQLISIKELTFIIQSTSIDKCQVFLTISRYLRDNSTKNTESKSAEYITSALNILTNANSIFPNNEKILCEIADIYFEYGYNDVATKFLTMVEEESQYTIHLKEKWRIHNEQY